MFETFLSVIKKNHLFFFTIVLIIFQIIAIIIKPYSIQIYSPVTIMTLYSFINHSISIYQLILSSIISTVIPFIICNLFKVSLKLNAVILHTILIFFVLTTMTIFKCIFIPALAYSLTAYKMLPQQTNTFLYSYIVATIIIIIICPMFFYIFKQLAKTMSAKELFDRVSNLEQLEKNIKL